MVFFGFSFITGVSVGVELTTIEEMVDDGPEMREMAEDLSVGVFTLDVLIIRFHIGI